MKKCVLVLASLAMFASVLFAATVAPAGAQGIYVVTSSDGSGSGPGTIRDALESGQTTIVIDDAVGTIFIDAPLVYDGTEALRVYGNGVTIDGDGLEDTLLEISEGVDLALFGITFDDGGGYSLGAEVGTAGVHVIVPSGVTGTVDVTLNGVTVRGVGGHGIWIDDNDGSSASVHVSATGVLVEDVGFGEFDRDGIRVDETGDGDITFTSRWSNFIGVGADGVELDERGAGSVFFDVLASNFNDNGDYCIGVDPENPSGSEEAECVEDDELDLDDGFDIDEADGGAISGTVRYSSADDNYDEGFDFDEAGSEGIDVSFTGVTANGNIDEGIKASEEDGGSLVASLRNTQVLNGQDNDGVEFEELGDGDLDVEARRLVSTGHDSSGLKLVEEDQGTLTADVRFSTLAGNGEDGLELEEVDDGDLTANVRWSNLAGNSDYGIQAEAGGASGTVTTTFVTLAGNGAGATDFTNIS
ncbi:MAG: hypothetical protein RIE08_15790 [Acidimicrobiales bacterium]